MLLTKKPPFTDDLIYIDFSPRLRTSSHALINCLARKVIFSQLREIATVLRQLRCSCPNPFFLIRPNFAFPEKSLRQLSNFATPTSTTTRQAARQSFDTQASNCFTRSRTKRAHLDDTRQTAQTAQKKPPFVDDLFCFF